MKLSLILAGAGVGLSWLLAAGGLGRDYTAAAPIALTGMSLQMSGGGSGGGSAGGSGGGKAHPVAMVRYDAYGKLIRPEGYREWVSVGTPLTPNDMNGGAAPFPEFHNVYIHPTAWEHYKNTGEFLDGTVLVKELISVGSKEAPSGLGYFMGDFIGLEATVKDTARYPDEPGGWAYFSFTNEDHSLPYQGATAMLPTASCAACHEANAEQDMVFTQFYPVAREVRAAAGGRP